MRLVGTWLRSLANLWNREAVERELDEELQATLDELAAEGEARGLSPVEARRRAQLALGGVEQVKEAVREERRGARLDRLTQDFRYALRVLRRSPGYALVAIATLALGIGGTTAIFSVARAASAEPSYPNADRLVHLWAYWPGGSGNFGYPDFLAMVEQNRSFERLAAYEAWGGVAMTGVERPRLLETSFVTADYFELVGAKAELGRLFDARENRPSSFDPVVVVSEACWRRELGADPTLVGKPLRLNGVPYTVVGVVDGALRDLGLAEGGSAPDVWLPAAAAPALLGQPPLSDAYSIYFGLGRLKPGVTLEQARTNLAEVAARRARESPATRTEHGLDLRPLAERTAGPVRAPALLLLAGAGLILILGCVNLANASLVRLERRRAEMAMRSALGASSGRLVQQLLIEAASVALIGGTAGLALAAALTHVLGRWVGEHVTALVDVRMDSLVFACAALLTISTVALFGLIPALEGRRVDLRAELGRAGARGSGSRRGTARSTARRALVVAEVALSMVLLVAAGLMVRSVARLLAKGVGFDTAHLLTLRADLTAARYADPGRRIQFASALVERLESVPGVRSATLWGPSMLSNATWVMSLFPGDREPNGPGDYVQAFRHSVNPEALANLGIALTNGRAFDAHDAADAPPVAIVSESLERELWPGKSAVGKRLRRPDPSLPLLTVVGVAADARHRNRYSLDDLAVGWPLGGLGPQRDVYLPYPQRPNPSVTLALRISGDAGVVTEAVRSAVGELDAELPLSDLALLDDRLASQERAPAMIARILVGFSAFSLLLAALGVYGVVAQSVEARAREIGVRVALGARPGEIVGRIVASGAAMACTGLAAGALGALVVARLMSAMLFDVSAFDPTTFASVAAVLLATALVTSYLPARSVLRRGALRALREE